MDAQTLWPMAEKALKFFVFALIELTVLFIGISFLVAVLQHYLSSDRVKSLLSARNGRGYLVGAGLGALTPFCSCSTIPIAAGLLKARAGFGPTMAFLFASPLVNPVLLMLFIPTFGFQITVVYASLALGLAAVAGWTMQRMGFQKHIRKDVLAEKRSKPRNIGLSPTRLKQPLLPSASSIHPMILEAMPTASSYSETCCADTREPGLPGKWRTMFNEAVSQFRTFLPYVVIGVGVGALCHGFVPDGIVYKYAGPENPLAVPTAAFIGVPLYVRASTLVPIGMSLLEKGMSIGAVMALIIGGAGASLPEMVMLKRMFKLPVLLAFLATVFGMAMSAGFMINIW
jgi:uncharacterized membrane protein YraQ (UPF0718 family)